MLALAAITLQTMLNSPAQATDESVELGRMQISAGRQAETTFDAVGFVSVIDEEDLEFATPQVVSDLLLGQPGVYVQQTTPGQGIPIVRGLKGSEVLHVVDGMRFNNAFFRNAPNQYLALFDPNWLQQVEVVRGPASTLYGADAMGGLVQFRTREARFADSSSYRQSDINLTLSSADDSAWVSGSMQGGTESQAYILQAGYQNVGDRSTARDGRLDQSDYTARSFRGQWRYLLDPSRDFSFDLQYLRQPSTPRIDQLIPGFGQDEADAVEFFFEPNQRLFAHARYHQSGLGFVDDMELHLSFQQIDDDRRSLDTGSTDRRLEENSSALLTLSGQFSSFWDDYDLVYGFEVTEDTVDSSRLSEDIITGLRERATSRFPDGSEQRSKAAFAEFSINRWINHDLQLGVRYTDIDIDLAESDRGVGASLNLDDLTANIGYRYQINPEMALIANIAEGFRSPNIFDLSTLGPRPGNRFNIANPDLEPEKLISYDIGLKWQSRRFEGELVLFQADYDDRIASVPTGEFTDTGREVVQSENINSQQNQGVELSWRYYAESGIDYEGAINWIRGEERDGNGQSQPGDRIPPMNARFAVRWPVTDDTTLRAWTDIARRQDRLSDRDIRDSRINPEGTPGYAIVNLQARHQINPVWDLNFSLRNLFDKAYRQHGSGIDAPGRHATLSISGQF